MTGSKVWSPVGANRSAAYECTVPVEQDSVNTLLRLLTLLANCGLNAGAPPVLESRGRS